jgi:hypothetical protein
MKNLTLSPQSAAALCRALETAPPTGVRERARVFARENHVPEAAAVSLAGGLRVLARACSEDQTTRLLAFDRVGAMRPAVLALASHFASSEDAIGKIANVVMPSMRQPPSYLH